MKFVFWFDLPKALMNIGQDIVTNEEQDFCRILLKSSEDFNRIFAAFNENFEANAQDIHREDLEKIREKLFAIQKEKVEMLCKSIKFSIKLMSKILSHFENYENITTNETELLTKIKLFLKITRMVVDNSKIALNESKAEREREFFTMISVFSEKIQSKVFTLSNAIINKIMVKKMNDSKKDKLPSQCKEQSEILNLIENQSFVVNQIK